jgi:PAS domain-containing protein
MSRFFLAVVLLCMGSDSQAQVQQSGSSRKVELDHGISIAYPASWRVLPKAFSNATELVALRSRERGAAPSARTVVTTERQLDHDAAVQRLADIAAETIVPVKYRTIAGWPALERVRPGTSFRDIITHRVKNGMYAGENPEHYISERIAAVSRRTPDTRVHELPGGRFIAINHRPMDDGGWVATHEDVTERETLKQRLDAALNNMAQGLAMFDAEHRLVVCNARFAAMYRLAPDQVKVGTTVRELLAYCVDNGSYAGRDPDQMLAATLKLLGSETIGYYTTKLNPDLIDYASLEADRQQQRVE